MGGDVGSIIAIHMLKEMGPSYQKLDLLLSDEMGATLQKQLVFSNRIKETAWYKDWPALRREWGTEAIYGYDVDSFLHSLLRPSQTKCAGMLTSCKTLHPDWLSMSLSQRSGWNRWTFLRDREKHFLPGHLAIVSKLKIVEGPVVTSKINQKKNKSLRFSHRCFMALFFSAGIWIRA